jgi:predicted membrane protein
MNRRPPVTPALVLGLVIFALGAILFLDRQGLIDGSRVFPFFLPAALLAVGLFKLALSGSGGGRIWGGILAAAGIVLLLDHTQVMRFSFNTLWPVALIVAGIGMVWRALEGPSERAPGDAAAVLNELVLLAGNDVKVDGADFRGGEAFAVLGGCQIDLRKASMKANQAVIHANALFGGIEIRVPPTWSVMAHGVPVFGGYSDETHQPSPAEAPSAKRLLVRGFAVFGGVVVKN